MDTKGVAAGFAGQARAIHVKIAPVRPEETAMTRRHLVLFGLAAFVPAAAWAHHGWSGYDAGQTLTVEGTVATLAYQNPHVTIGLKTEAKTWDIVLAPPFRMQSRGLPDGSIRIGDTVTVIGYPHKTEQTELRAERIVIAGKTVELR
jgi:hypothetical protein